jgi:ribonuclease J
VHFLALGGAGEIGLNCSAYQAEGRWLVVDCGVLFRDPDAPLADLILPDVRFLAARRDALAGLVVTHAHQDHLGAIPHLWPRLGCPIYATPFCAAVLRKRLAPTVPLRVVEPGRRAAIGPFDVEVVTLTHSIPEPAALVVRTREGTVVHTGDWRLDPTPLVGAPVDAAPLVRAGDEGVLALVGDSTNATLPHPAPSEAEVRAALVALFPRLRRRIAVTCFASNVARIASVAAAAEAAGRHVALVGRAFREIVEAARQVGLLEEVAPFVDEADAGYLPPERVVLLVSGSQGEPRGALARLAADAHGRVLLDPGDTVVLSSRTIPGNELDVAGVVDLFRRRGIAVIAAADPPADPREAPLHVTGHPSAEELTTMYRWVRPRAALPVHGERRHQEAHAAVARAAGVGFVHVPTNGELIALSSAEPPRVIARVEAGRSYRTDEPASPGQ